MSKKCNSTIRFVLKDKGGDYLDLTEGNNCTFIMYKGCEFSEKEDIVQMLNKLIKSSDFELYDIDCITTFRFR